MDVWIIWIILKYWGCEDVKKGLWYGVNVYKDCCIVIILRKKKLVMDEVVLNVWKDVR